MNPDAPTFQETILALQNYWAGQGCVVLQPYDSEVGAGTFHWATTLRALGDKPWRTCYAQPCRRPADGRYGENPNRLQHYYQFQVLMKPSPDNPQELYLDSLRAIGIEPAEHDVRFVEDDWESPTLGAWGLGWEVWLNGMEVTQFTYFQQVGGIEVWARPGRRRPTGSSASPCRHRRASTRSTTWYGRAAPTAAPSPTATCTSRTSASSRPITSSSSPTWTSCAASSTSTRPSATGALRPASRCPPTTACSSAPMRLTCSTRGVRSAPPSVPPTSCASAPSPRRAAKRAAGP